MPVVEVVVARRLEARVQPRKAGEGVAIRAMEMHAVLLERIVGGEIHAAAEPP